MVSATPWLEGVLAENDPDPEVVTSLLGAVGQHNDEPTAKLVFKAIEIPRSNPILRQAALDATLGNNYKANRDSSSRYTTRDLAVELLAGVPQNGVTPEEALGWLRELNEQNLGHILDVLNKGLNGEGDYLPMDWIPLEARARFVLWCGITRHLRDGLTSALHDADEINYTLALAASDFERIPNDVFPLALADVAGIGRRTGVGSDKIKSEWKHFVFAAEVRPVAKLLQDPRGQYEGEILDALPIGVLAREDAPALPVLTRHVTEAIGAGPEAWKLLLDLSATPSLTIGEATTAIRTSLKEVPRTKPARTRARKPRGTAEKVTGK